MRENPTRAPSERATSSPRARALRERPADNAITVPTTRKGATWAATVMSRPATDPTAQNRYWSRVDTSSSRTVVVMEPRKAVTAAPASASLTGVAPSRPSAPRAYTATDEIAAPAKANQT